jgi:Putative Ig domain/FG-GAP repeat
MQIFTSNIGTHISQWRNTIFACLVSAISLPVFAQIPSATLVTSATNPSVAGQSVTLSAKTTSGFLATTFSTGLGRVAGSALYYRYDLINTTFRATVVNSNLKNQTIPAAFSSIVVAQGGGVGERFVVFQVTAGVGGVTTSQVVQFDAPLTTITATTAIGYSVHETASSSFGEMPANTAVLFRPDNALASTFAPPFTIGGTHTYKNGGAAIAGCNALATVAGESQCTFVFPLAGTLNINVDYSGDVNYAASNGVLTGGQVVRLDISPPVLPNAKVSVAYTTGLTATGANGAATFTLLSGSIPNGLTLDASGTLAGTTLAAGPYEFTVNTADTSGASGSRKLSLTVDKGDQTITFAPPSTATIGSSITLNGVASSGLLISYSINTPSVCTSTGAELKFISTGSCSVTPIQSGDNNWFAAPSIPRAIIVLAPGGVRPLFLRSGTGESQSARLVANQLQFTSQSDPGVGFRTLGLVDIDGNKTLDLAFLNTTQGDLGEVSVWHDVNPATSRLLRSVRTLWRVDAVGDLDGDGFGDLVWRFTGQTPNLDDTGVSYVWFINANGVTVRKRGGAPLNWQLLGAVDLNQDNAADMLYISPTNDIRALMATSARSCANLSAGNIPQGFVALKAASFIRYGRGDVLIRNSTTGEVRLIALDATGLTLPPSTSSPDDPNAACTPSNLLVKSSIISMPNTDPTWRYYGAADFNGDGLTDVIWARPDGTLTVWLSNGDNQAATVIDNAGIAPNGFVAIIQ